jgi:hypothetical protein
MNAMKKLRSDLTVSPGNAEEQIDCYMQLHGPDMPFSIIQESRRVVEQAQKNLLEV